MNSELNVLVSMITSGIIIAFLLGGAWKIGYEIGQAFRRNNEEGNRQRTPSPPQRRVPVSPGPLWQNSRIWEDQHLQQQMPIQFHETYGDYPEINSTDNESENRLTWRLERGQRRRL